MQRQHVGLGEQRLLAGGHPGPPSTRLGDRILAPPGEHAHTECLSVPGDDRADLAVAVDPERLAAQADPDRIGLPLAGPERVHLLWNAPERRDDEPPDELSSGIRRT